MYNGKLKKYNNAEMAEFTHEQLAGGAALIFVCDRTEADVERVKELNDKYIRGIITDEEREEWSRGFVKKNSLAYELGVRGAEGLKGALNVEDIARVEWNISVIAGFLSMALTTKEWDYNDIPRVSDYQRIQDNTERIRNDWIILSDTPEVPQQPLNTYDKWNDIEKILHDVYAAYMRFAKSLYRCGEEIYAGEGVGIL